MKKLITLVSLLLMAGMGRNGVALATDLATGSTITTSDGATYTTTSGNKISNGSFDDGFTGWTNSADYSTEITSENFTLVTDDSDGNVYLVGTGNGGASSTSSLGTAWEIGAGKNYVLIYKVKRYTGWGDSSNGSYLKTALTNTPGKEWKLLEEDGKDIVEDWKEIIIPFSNGETGAINCYQYLQVEFRWLNNQFGFDDFQLYEVSEETADVNDDEYKNGDKCVLGTVTYNVKSDNLFVNGGFTDGVTGWQAKFYSESADISNFTGHANGGFNNGHYITVTSNVGAEDAHTLCQAIQVEAGKQYLFIGYTNGTAPSSDNMRYNGLMRMDSSTHEVLEDGKTSGHDAIVEAQLNWGNGTDWEKTQQVFTAETDYVGVRFTWCNGASFDGIQLYEIAEAEEEEDVEEDEPKIITYTDDLVVTIGSDSTEPATTSIDVEYATDGTINFVLKNFVLKTGDLDMAIGNIEVDGITLSGPDDDVEYQTFSYDGTVTITKGDLDGVRMWWGTMLGEVPIVMEGKITEDKLYTVIDIDLSSLSIFVHVVFGSDFDSSEEDDPTTAISGVEASAGNDAIYTLSGTRVNKAVKGVYIIGGKKVLVK